MTRAIPWVLVLCASQAWATADDAIRTAKLLGVSADGKRAVVYESGFDAPGAVMLYEGADPRQLIEVADSGASSETASDTPRAQLSDLEIWDAPGNPVHNLLPPKIAWARAPASSPTSPDRRFFVSLEVARGAVTDPGTDVLPAARSYTVRIAVTTPGGRTVIRKVPLTSSCDLAPAGLAFNTHRDATVAAHWHRGTLLLVGATPVRCGGGATGTEPFFARAAVPPGGAPWKPRPLAVALDREGLAAERVAAGAGLEAERWFALAYDEDPTFEPSLFHLARSAASRGDVGRVVQCLAALQKLDTPAATKLLAEVRGDPGFKLFIAAHPTALDGLLPPASP